jgi:hypothetical protein
MVCHEPVGNVNSCRRMSTADILSKSIPVDISFGLAAMPGSETRFSNAALSMNLKLIVNCENPHYCENPQMRILTVHDQPTGSARDKIL